MSEKKASKVAKRLLEILDNEIGRNLKEVDDTLEMLRSNMKEFPSAGASDEVYTKKAIDALEPVVLNARHAMACAKLAAQKIGEKQGVKEILEAMGGGRRQ